MTSQGTKNGLRKSVLGAILLINGACLDLGVENLAAPDRERAMQNPNDVLAFIGGAFYPTFHTAMQGTSATNHFPYASSEMTSSLNGAVDGQQMRELLEPRVSHNNDAQIQTGSGPHGPRNYWAAIGRAANIPFEGLQVIEDGMDLTENGEDVTQKARAFAKFMQGWAWGYTALIFDRVHIVPETQRLPENPSELNTLILNSLVPYNEAIEAAIGAMDAAILIAQQNPTEVAFLTPYPDNILWFGSPTPISNQKFIQMANTLKARFLVLSARTPQERASLDWNRVIQWTSNGLTDDFEFALTTARTNNYLQRIQNNTIGGAFNGRWDYRTIGPADQSGSYQAWIASSIPDRARFNIVTPDRRITGATSTSDGSYTRYRDDNNGFPLERGSFFQSAYQWSRQAIRLGLSGTAVGHNSGTHRLITADENNLLRAEALLRTGDLQGAADLINITRTRTQVAGGVEYPGLPPVTAAGVPTAADGACVPRQDNGACGTLMTALRYERMLELAGIDIMRGYADSRGFGILAEGSLLEYPVPGNVLELYNLPPYSYGGVGQPNTATYSPVN